MTPDEIRSWLRANGKDRFWLADKVGVSKFTVDKWLAKTSGRKIPDPVMKVIRGLMEPEKSQSVPTLTGKLSIQDFLLANEAAKDAGMSFDEWITMLIKDAIEERD